MPPAWIHIATLRRMDGLHALRLGRRRGDPGVVFDEECIPLPAADEPPGTIALMEAWARLAAVKEIEPAVLADVHTVLDRTVADPTADRSALPALTIAPPPPPHKPTAANPRAYKGTKDRPPKPRRPDTMDLRPFLCVPGGQDRLLELLTARLGPVALPTEFREAPGLFRRYFETVLRETPSARNAALATYHALGLAADAPLRRAIAVWFHVAPEAAGPWCALLAGIRPERREDLRRVVWDVADPFHASGTLGDDLLPFDALIDDEQFDERWSYVLARHRDAPETLDDVAATLGLLDEHGAPLNLAPESPPPIPVDRERIRSFAAAVADVPDWLVARLVVAAAKVPGLGAAVELVRPIEPRGADSDFAEAPAEPIGPAHAQDLADALCLLEHDDDPQEALRDTLRGMPGFLSTLRTLPASHRDKAIRLFREFVSEESTADLDDARRLAEVVCRPPFPADGHVHVVLEAFTWLERTARDEVLEGPESSFRTLEEESSRKNDAFLIAYGLAELAEHEPSLVAAMFLQAPAELCRATKTLGLLSTPMRLAKIAELRAHPIFSSTDAAATAELLASHPSPSVSRHLPRQLRRHLAGDIELRPNQVTRHLERIATARPAILCDLLEHLAQLQLSRGLVDLDRLDFGALSAEMVHALRIQSGLEDNRRGLRRLIRACFDGDDAFLDNHPSNRTWLQNHPKIDRRTWTQGLTREGTVDGRTVRLALERDPLEALRLGTYVGSCLGVGGSFSWSAAATVLDINKQVVFARDANGNFLARQILAVTDADQLACYEIYPAVAPEMQALFRDFDRATADALGIPITTEDESTVSEVLAQDWWDDPLWDLEITERDG